MKLAVLTFNRLLAVTALVMAVVGCETGVDPDIGPANAGSPAVTTWMHFGRDEGGRRFSSLETINPENVKQLRKAWEYHTGDLDPARFNTFSTRGFQATPLLAQDTLYFCSPLNQVIALDPATGKEKWSYAAEPNLDGVFSIKCRGVSYHVDTAAKPEDSCAARILTGTVDGRLLALDAKTGQLCTEFGDGGEVDLTADLGKVNGGDYIVTSPPQVIGNKVITGALVTDLQHDEVPSGVVRAYDVRSGSLVWAWDPLQENLRLPTGFKPGSPNAWAPFSADSERKLVFVPTGNPAGDYYGGGREGADYFGSSVIALNTDTGELAWRFQTVHHDIWDYDVPAQPVLFDFPGDDGPIPALVQATKTGFLFVLNRETGEPILPVEERAVPGGGPAPDALSPTQPFPILPEPLHPERLTEEDMFGFVWFDKQACVRQFRELNNEGLFTPISTKPTLVYPGYMGGSNWGGVSWDPQRKLLIANTSRLPAIVQLIPREGLDAQAREKLVEPQLGTPYAVERSAMLSPLGAPCNRPPWGVLTAIEFPSGKKRWEVPLGNLRDLAPFPLWMNLGVPNSGGSLLTASGLTFIAATTDSYMRAFETATGRELWRDRLPAGGHATPMTFQLENGSQYVVVAAGGNNYMGSKQGDSLVAYALSR